MKNTIYLNAKQVIKDTAKSLEYLGTHDKPLRRQTLNDQADEMRRQFDFWAMKGSISEKQTEMYKNWIDNYTISLHEPKQTSKTTSIKVIQQNYGQGWEDNSEYWPDQENVKELIKHDLKEYRLTGYPTRLINRRVSASRHAE